MRPVISFNGQVILKGGPGSGPHGGSGKIKVGDRVKISEKGHLFRGKTGKVVAINSKDAKYGLSHKIKLDQTMSSSDERNPIGRDIAHTYSGASGLSKI